MSTGRFVSTDQYRPTDRPVPTGELQPIRANPMNAGRADTLLAATTVSPSNGVSTARVATTGTSTIRASTGLAATRTPTTVAPEVKISLRIAAIPQRSADAGRGDRCSIPNPVGKDRLWVRLDLR